MLIKPRRSDIVQSRFGFLRNFNALTTDEIRYAAAELVLTYNTDLENMYTENEMIQFGDLSKLFAREHTNETSPELFPYQLLKNETLKNTVPNVEVLRMYLVLMVANCSGERSFSKLKFVKIN